MTTPRRRRRKNQQPARPLRLSKSISMPHTKWGEYLPLVVVAAIALIYAISPAGQSGRETGNKISQANAQEAVMTATTSRQLQELETSAELGNQIYEQLCTIPTVKDGDVLRALAITADTQYLDGTTGLPIVVGELICDDNGNAAQVVTHPETGEAGYPGVIYRASDSDLINKRFSDSFDRAGVPVLRSNSGLGETK